MVKRPTPAETDTGTVLVLTLILVTVMSVIVVALLQYVTVGLRTADVATARTDTNSDSANVMNWAIEQLAKKQIQITDLPAPGSDCSDKPDNSPVDSYPPNGYTELTVPAGLAANGSTTTLYCARTNPINGEPVVHLVARSVGRQERVIEATVEVPEYSHGARVSDWRVDIPIAVPAYTTTTTSPAPTTTVASNSPPFAADMSVSVGIDDAPYALALPVSDPEGDSMTISNLTPTAGGEITVTDGGGTTALVSATTAGMAMVGNSYTFTYRVNDGQDSNDGAVTVLVETTGTPPTTSTTTTLPPNSIPDCDFVITSAESGGSSGIGVLTVSNSGADFTGWQIQLAQKNSAKPWQFSWGPGVTATVGSVFVDVSGNQLITTSTPFSESAGLVHSFNGQPKIVVSDTLNCSVISP